MLVKVGSYHINALNPIPSLEEVLDHPQDRRILLGSVVDSANVIILVKPLVCLESCFPGFRFLFGTKRALGEVYFFGRASNNLREQV